jgi:hypothetical protein
LTPSVVPGRVACRGRFQDRNKVATERKGETKMTMLKSHKAKIHAEAAPRNRKHTVSHNAHKAGSLKIVAHKGGGSKKRANSKKTIL